jgi:DNA-binding IclR family transcriptional regulator
MTGPASKIDREYLRSALRCFDALELLNAHRMLSTGELARLLGVPRTTAARILRTLAERGYVSRNAAGRFTLTLEVNRLASGYTHTEQALPRIRAVLTSEAQTFLWPLCVVLPHAGALYTFAPTDALTPYKLISTPEGARIPFMGTASGAVYLAYCTAEERLAILRMAAEDPACKDITMAHVESDVKIAKAQGYLVKSDWQVGGRRFRQIYQGQTVVALPLFADGQIRGCLTARLITSAVPKADIAAKIFPRLQTIAGRLGPAWQAAGQGPHMSLAAE